MSKFQPMVKMHTDEPSVSLKLKKGGKVKAHHKAHEEHGHKAMHHAAKGLHHAFESEAGKAPKKPSMAERHKAMNPNLYAKGGKVAHKGMGGAMPMPGQGMPMANPEAMKAAKLAKLRQMAMAQGAPAPMGIKKGGKIAGEKAELNRVEQELKHHEAMKAGKAHHGLKGGGKVSGAEIDRDETKTTVEHNEKKFANTKVYDGEHADHTSGKSGIVKLGNAGGYKHGGHAKKHHYAAGGRATGSSIPSETNESETRGHSEMGGTIEGNEHFYEDTDLHSGRPFSGSKTTGEVHMSNAGGYRRGGKAKVHHKAEGGAIDKYNTRNTIEGGNWENRPADTAKPGKRNTKTGEVKLANGGGYKHGGHAAKKAYATGGNVNDMGRSVAMPKKALSQPVANSLQSGTFRKGGKVGHYYDGDSVTVDPTPSNSIDTRGEKYANGGSTWGVSTPMRLVKTHTGPQGHVAKVYKDRDWGEHRVKLFSPEGKHHENADYHTDDKEDALSHALHMVNKGYAKGGKSKK